MHLSPFILLDYSLKGISLTLLVAIYANIEDFNADFQKFQMTD